MLIEIKILWRKQKVKIQQVKEFVVACSYLKGQNNQGTDLLGYLEDST